VVVSKTCSKSRWNRLRTASRRICHQGSPTDPLDDEVDPLAPLEASQRVLQRAKAARAAALLDAYLEAMAEMAAVFGPDAGDRDSPFARSFLLEAAQVLHLHERTAGILLDTAGAIRGRGRCSPTAG
jgi:hypothetical protein